MAKNIQEAEVVVTLNGQAAKNTINQMTQEYNRLRRSALEAYKAGQDALGKKLDAQAQKLMKDIQVTRVETKKFADILKNVNGASLKELRGAAKQLQSEIAKLKPGTQEFITKTKQLKEVNTRINQLTASFKGLVAEEKAATLSINTLAQSFNKYFTMITAGIAAITGVSMAFRKCAQDAAAMDDAYATVMKTTGLTHEEVEQLNEAFKKMDTRTAREELNRMAYEAGKLGFTGVNYIQQFVEAADIINVALGDVLGEGATLEIAKLAQVFAKSTEALDNLDLKGRMLAVGSAVNQLGKDSTASESYMVEFLGRLGGVAVQAGLSADQILGFASALDQTKQKVEMSATAFQKLIQQMIKKPEEFVEAAQMPLEEFKELMATDMNGAILKVLQGFQEMGGFLEQVPMFKEMGLDGARAAGVMSSLAGNLELVARAQSVANEHNHLGTSMTREYNIMNESMQAQLEKRKKELRDTYIELGEKLNPVLLKSTKLVTYLIKLLVAHGKEIRNAVIAIALLTAAIKAQAIADAIRTKGLQLWNTVSRTAQFLSNKLYAAYYRLTGQTLKYAAAQKAANAAASKSVYGLIAIAVGALVYKLTELNERMQESAEVAEKVKSVEEKIAETYAEEKGRIEVLTKMVNNNNLSLDDRRQALLRLKEIVPGYHAELTEEGILINNNTKAIDEYLTKFKERTRLQAYEDTYAENEKKIAETEIELHRKKEEKQQRIIDNGGEYPDVFTTKQNSKFSFSNLAGKGGTNIPGMLLGAWLDKQVGLTTQELSSFGVLLNDITDLERDLNKYKNQRKRLEKEVEGVYEESGLDGDGGNGASKENDYLTKAQFDFLNERYDKLKKKEKELINKGYESLTDEEAKALRARYTKLTQASVKEEDKRYQEQVKQLEKEQKDKENELLSQYLHSDMTMKQYEERRLQIQKSFLKERLVLAKQEGKDTTEIEAQLLQLRSEKMKQSFNDRLDELNECYADEQRALKRSLTAQEITQDEYDSQMLESKVRYLKDKLALAVEYGQDEADFMKAYEEAIKESQDLAFEQMEKLKKKAKDVSDELHPKEARAKQKNLELNELQKLYDLKLITEEDFQKKKKSIIKKYNKENLDDDLENIKDYASKANSIMEQASNFVTALKEAESAKLEAQYQADLTAAGDNAEQREQIEAAYEQKKLDLQKKYADTEMAINIAKTIAAGALAAIQAFAQLGPIAGAVAAALIAVTTAAEVAMIVQQRNAIKNTSVNNSGSSSVKTGTRTINEGYAEGGYTEDHTTLTTVGERGREWVAPHWMVQKHPVHFANLERYRKAGSHGRSGSMSTGFAAGGFTAGNTSGNLASNAVNISDIELAVENAINRSLANGHIRAFLVRQDLTDMDNQTKRFKSMTNRG